MPLDFPASPSVNDTYTFSGRTWKWNGSGWQLTSDGVVGTTNIANDAVTYSKIQNVSDTDKLLGRSTAGAGDIEEITCTAAGRELLDDVDAATQRTTLGLGTLATQSGTFSGTSSGTNTGDQTITLTGDVTGSGTGSFAATIASGAVTSAKIADGTIVDGDISASAEIAVSKLADGTARQLLQTDAAGTGVEWTSNVDIPGTLDVTGAATFDSTAAHPLGSVAAPTITFTGDTNTGIWSPAADTLAVSTNGSECARIDSRGNIFANNATPTSTIWATENVVFSQGYVGTNGSFGMDIVGNGYRNTSSGWTSLNRNGQTGRTIISLRPEGDIVFGADNLSTGTEPTIRMRIDSTGKVGLGRTPTAALDVYAASGNLLGLIDSDSLADTQGAGWRATGGARDSTIGVYKHSGITNPCAYIALDTEDNVQNNLWVDNSDQLRISTNAAHMGTTSGTVVGTQTSDERLKDILGPVEYGLDTLKQLEPVRYALKSEPTTEKLGFIAQQVLPLVPQSVFDTGEHIEGEPEDARTKLGMEYVSLIPVLVNAIKELSAEVDALKARVTTLES